MSADELPAADRTWLESHRGIGKGARDVHAGNVLAFIDRVVTERDRANQAAADAEARIQALAVAVHAAVNHGGSMADVVAAIARMPAIADRLEQLGRPTIPSPRRRTP